MNEDINPMLRKLDALQALSDGDQFALKSIYSRTIDYEAHIDIAREGDRVGECGLLMSGIACRYSMTTEGKRQITGFVVPGDIFDVQSFLLDVMDHSIASMSACTVAVIPHTALVALTENSGRLALAVWRESLVEAATFREWVVNVGRRSAYQRIAHIMCELYCRLETVGLVEGSTIRWPITQSDIGDACGLSIVHVNRSLQALRGNDLIVLQNGILTIKDWDGLAEAGEFDGTFLHRQ
ncbi:Crp/Fnr family transcriptional regulator [Amorphus sp. 3PC139-8]|uniref:Crp/Fnr family transcriptional regulator n=1 Tax=Amorphus sp. 3PC139-8 TaxID=2735676 RepID=UPI00345D75AE